MIRKVRRTSQARQDIIDIYTYLYLRSPRAADKVFDAVEQSIRQLGRFSGVGNQWKSPIPALRGLRYTPITGYRNFLIFFRVKARVVEVFRIVHAARELTHVVDEIEPD